jgi:hypothetical protein
LTKASIGGVLTKGPRTGRDTAKLDRPPSGEGFVTIAVGLFSLGLVLGWAALFVRAEGLGGALARTAWLAVLALLVALSPQPVAAAAGVASGLVAHLLLLSGLRERRA